MSKVASSGHRPIVGHGQWPMVDGRWSMVNGRSVMATDDRSKHRNPDVCVCVCVFLRLRVCVYKCHYTCVYTKLIMFMHTYVLPFVCMKILTYILPIHLFIYNIISIRIHIPFVCVYERVCEDHYIYITNSYTCIYTYINIQYTYQHTLSQNMCGTNVPLTNEALLVRTQRIRGSHTRTEIRK